MAMVRQSLASHPGTYLTLGLWSSPGHLPSLRQYRFCEHLLNLMIPSFIHEYAVSYSQTPQQMLGF